MYVGWRDLKVARGRFALVLVAVLLITVLVGLLSGLTAGLGRESTSLVTGLDAGRVVLSSDSFETSQVDPARVPGSEPLGIATVRAQGDHSTTAVTLVGIPAGSTVSPAGREVGPGRVVLTTAAAEALGTSNVTLGSHEARVAAVHGDESFAHTPVVWTDLATWQQVTGTELPTALTLSPGSATETPLPSGWQSMTPDQATSAIPGYSSEHGSLLMIRGFLLVISALVIGAFFTVWTMQRTRDVAVLKALGASNAAVLRDALGQAGVVLVAGIALGGLLASAIGALAAQVVPFHLTLGLLGLPLLILLVLGLLGAALAVRRVLTVDPLLALNGR